MVLCAVIALCVAAAGAKRSGDIPLPAVPAELREPQARADYIIEHFWEPADSLGDYSRTAIEQAFSNFISVFPLATEPSQTAAVKALMAKAAKSHDDYALIAEIADTYLYSTDSPVESEDYYIMFLREIVDSPVLDDDEKIRPSFQLANALKNRPGDLAADFPFITRDGVQSTLYGAIDAMKDKSPAKILLVLYDPDCGHCRRTMDALVKLPAVTDGSVAVIAVFSGDDMDEWLKTAQNLPENWIVGFEDGTMLEEGAYVVRTFPSIYIISPEKIVVEKEASLESLR